MLAELLERWSQLEGDRCQPFESKRLNKHWLRIYPNWVQVYSDGSVNQSLAVIEYAVRQAISDRPDWVATYGFGPHLPNGTAEHAVTIYPTLTSSYSATSAIGAEAWLSAYLRAVEGVRVSSDA